MQFAKLDLTIRVVSIGVDSMVARGQPPPYSWKVWGQTYHLVQMADTGQPALIGAGTGEDAENAFPDNLWIVPISFLCYFNSECTVRPPQWSRGAVRPLNLEHKSVPVHALSQYPHDIKDDTLQVNGIKTYNKSGQKLKIRWRIRQNDLLRTLRDTWPSQF